MLLGVSKVEQPDPKSTSPSTIFSIALIDEVKSEKDMPMAPQRNTAFRYPLQSKDDWDAERRSKGDQGEQKGLGISNKHQIIGENIKPGSFIFPLCT